MQRNMQDVKYAIEKAERCKWLLIDGMKFVGHSNIVATLFSHTVKEHGFPKNSLTFKELGYIIASTSHENCFF